MDTEWKLVIEDKRRFKMDLPFHGDIYYFLRTIGICCGNSYKWDLRHYSLEEALSHEYVHAALFDIDEYVASQRWDRIAWFLQTFADACGDGIVDRSDWK